MLRSAKTGNSFTAELKQPDGIREPVNGIEARPVGFSPSGKVTNAEVVFVGFGIVSTELKYDSYKTDGQEIDVAGKVVMVYNLMHAGQGQPSQLAWPL